MSEWHIDGNLARAYGTGGIADAEAWSVEAHVERCTPCGRLLSSVVSADPVLGLVRERVLDDVATPVTGFVRLVVAPALSMRWLVGLIGVVAGVIALDLLDAAREPVLLLVAPIVPVVGVAIGCARSVDPTAELTASAPMPALRVLLMRAAVVLAVSVVPLLGASLVTGVGPVAWLAPTAAMLGVALALATAVAVERATMVSLALWIVAASSSVAIQRDTVWVFEPVGQAMWGATAALCIAVFVARYRQLDDRGFVL